MRRNALRLYDGTAPFEGMDPGQVIKCLSAMERYEVDRLSENDQDNALTGNVYFYTQRGGKFRIDVEDWNGGPFRSIVFNNQDEMETWCCQHLP